MEWKGGSRNSTLDVFELLTIDVTEQNFNSLQFEVVCNTRVHEEDRIVIL